jgi:hypothetical protein
MSYAWRATGALICLVMIGGCAVIGLVAEKTAGGRTPAAYDLGKRTTFVLAERYENPSGVELDSEPLARYVTDELSHKQSAPIIPADKIDALRRAQGANFHKMTIPQIGRELGAQQIIYINIRDIKVDRTVENDMTRGTGDVRVRVVDAQTGMTLWPSDVAEGHPIAFVTPMMRVTPETTDWLVRDTVDRGLGVNVARLFYSIAE